MEKKVEITHIITAFRILQVSLFLVIVISGVDKFFNILTIWEQYFPDAIFHFLPISKTLARYPLGVLEIVIGILVLFRPKIGSILLAGLLFSIALTLLLFVGYYNIANVDIGLGFAAVALHFLTYGLGK
jgi:hypothetical protein